MSRKPFYDSLRPSLGRFSQAQVDGFNLILDEGARRKTPINDLAYILATAWWETGRTMEPVREAFYVASSYNAAEAWRRRNLRYYPYYGRGFIQLTWRFNYQKAGDKLGVDFVSNPDAVMKPAHAVKIMFDGMEEGWFTGKALDDYIDDIDESDNEDLREFSNARRIVNGTDKQVTIGKLALDFERALKAMDWSRKLDRPPLEPKPNPQPDDPGPNEDDGTDIGPAPDHCFVRLMRWLFG